MLSHKLEIAFTPFYVVVMDKLFGSPDMLYLSANKKNYYSRYVKKLRRNATIMQMERI